MFHDFEIQKVLIIAPLRVAKNTWPAELQKWDHLKGIRYSVVIGTAAERIAALRADADIYLINRENLSWLIEKSGMPFDFDMVVIDELSSFKNWQSKRFKAMMMVRPRVKRIVGLTGTPTSNGLMDLFAEFKVLDMGVRLGRMIGQYRNQWTDRLQLQTFARSRRTDLSENQRYYDQHENSGQPAYARIGYHQL